ncbi:hypothetical protein AQUCO_04100111v1 [Aquilegia coerulea]|uniref:Prolyl 4-hydroxylase alpha subunit domain-containing protein n=1 Tax=Aquilegia coerulea TaxID=218851 RepID=A0A2G5CQ69_AQUCA|nr:hypothetical protein AQUCO_04100111v1 [Aquilegia coerulea]
MMMSVDSSVDRRDESQSTGNGNGNGVVTATNRTTYLSQRLRLNRNEAHQPENYDDLELEFNPALYGKMEQYLPPNLLTATRFHKLEYMKVVLDRYLTDHDRVRIQKHKEYRQYIISSYQPLHKEIYVMHPATFFVPSFIKAITENTEESLRSIISEPSPGVYTFEMLQPHFCELLLSEVESFEKWVQEAKFKIMRPNTMNKYGAVLDDFGLETMLDNLMNDFIRPISRVFFPEVGGTSLDSHHGFVVEYGKDRDYELGFHVDDSEVTLNVCLGKQFSGGELFFRGVRCDKHVNTDTQAEFLTIPMSLEMVCFIVVATGMVPDLQRLGIEPIYSFGAEVLFLESRGSIRKIFQAGAESVYWRRKKDSVSLLKQLRRNYLREKEKLWLE